MICKCIVIGWVGNISVSQKNISIVTCSVGYQSTKKGADGKYEQNFINCVCFDNVANNVLLYLKKGDKVYMEGNLNIQQYVDKQGYTRNSTSLLVGMFRIIESKMDREMKKESKHNEAIETIDVESDKEISFPL